MPQVASSTQRGFGQGSRADVGTNAGVQASRGTSELAKVPANMFVSSEYLFHSIVSLALIYLPSMAGSAGHRAPDPEQQRQPSWLSRPG